MTIMSIFNERTSNYEKAIDNFNIYFEMILRFENNK